MRRFFRDTRGSTPIWAAFAILILFMLSFVVYAGVTVYAKYQTCETELERAATVTVDMSMVNPNVRDSVLNIPAVPAKTLLTDNMTGAGWTQEDGNWVKRDGGKLIYGLEDMEITVEEKTMRIDAVFAMPLPWAIGGMDEIRIPMKVLSSVLYIE